MGMSRTVVEHTPSAATSSQGQSGPASQAETAASLCLCRKQCVEKCAMLDGCAIDQVYAHRLQWTGLNDTAGTTKQHTWLGSGLNSGLDSGMCSITGCSHLSQWSSASVLLRC